MTSTSHQLFRNTLDRLPVVPELRSSEALGRSATNAHVSLEFQIGTSLVWYQFDASADERDAITAGNELLLVAHASAGKAMQLAEDESRCSVGAFWAEFDCTTAKENPLSIWGVRLRIAEGEIVYDIS